MTTKAAAADPQKVRAALAALDAQAGKVVAKYDEARAATLPLLHLAQDTVGFVTPEIEEWVSKWSGQPVVRVRAVSTFYSMYHHAPVGRHHIRFCTGTSCVLGGCEKLLAYVKAKLGVDNHGVTPDGRFSLEEAECLCACEGAPMMQVGDDYHLNLDEKAVDRILDGKK